MLAKRIGRESRREFGRGSTDKGDGTAFFLYFFFSDFSLTHPQGLVQDVSGSSASGIPIKISTKFITSGVSSDVQDLNLNTDERGHLSTPINMPQATQELQITVRWEADTLGKAGKKWGQEKGEPRSGCLCHSGARWRSGN